MSDPRVTRLRRLHALRETNELRLLDVEAALRGLETRLERAHRGLATREVGPAQRDSLAWAAIRLGELNLLALRLRRALRRDDERIARLTKVLRAEALRP